MSKTTRIINKKPGSKKVSTASSSITGKNKALRSIKSPINNILRLQQTIGNQAVQRLIESGSIQAKLKIGAPNDKYEQEADRIANRVMSMPEPKQSMVNGHSSSVQRKSGCPECPEKEGIQTKPIADLITPLVQRQAEPEEEEPVQSKLQRQAEDEEEEPVQAKQARNQTPSVSSNIESSVNSLKGGGQPLPESARSYFEPRFGTDFSQVRMHSNSQASETAKSINAKAFTKGKDVVFGAGQYSPGTSTGKKLMAHELAHVVQQRGFENRIKRKKQYPAAKINNYSTTQRIQRYSWGVGNPIRHPDGGRLVEVPKYQRGKVEKGLNWVKGVVNEKSNPCHRMFNAHCTRFKPNPLRRVFNSAKVWFWENAPRNQGGTSAKKINAMAYTITPFRLGILPLAANFFHEMLHLCGVKSEKLADMAKRTCGVPSIHYIKGRLVKY